VCYVLNHTYNETVQNIPLTSLTGVTVDISVLLRFHFWQKVYFLRVDSSFPSDSREAVGHIVGISEHVGNALTWKILTSDTKKLIFRSQVRPYDSEAPNYRADVSGGEDSPIVDPVIKSRHVLSPSDNGETIQDDAVTGEVEYDVDVCPPVFNPEDLIGRTFLMDSKEDGQRLRARVVQLIQDHESDLDSNPTRTKFLCSVNNDVAQELISYNQLSDYITRDDESDIVWKFRRITSHQGPLTPDHPDYNGSMYNIMIEWETGEVTSEPLSVIAADDPVTCAIYAKENNLLDLPGWKRFKSIAKRQKKFTRMVNQAKLRSYNTAPKYKYGYEVPRDYSHALRIDAKNGNTRWADAVKLEFLQIDEYETFQDLGHMSKATPPSGHKKIRVHLVFDVKHDGRHKARLVADGHLTEIPLESVYSSVVSLRGFRLALFLAELNKLETWATDIGNAYLEAHTAEKLYIIGGPEFGDRHNHILVICRALYGLRSSGARWHDRFADCLRDLGFQSCKAEPDIWLRKNGGIYEYVAVYVDDLALVLVDPQSFVSTLTVKYNFKFKGTGPIKFHLGMDFYRDGTGTLCIAPKKYIEKMVATYQQMFGCLPKQTVTSPLEKSDHPELDTSELLDSSGITQYQSLIGALQWVISIGRFDVMTAVMTMSSFRGAPRQGHLERVKRIYGYLSKMRHGAIRIRTDEPDYSDLPNLNPDWSRSVYGEVHELLPTDAPEPLGRYITLSHFVDANLMHDVVTGRSVTGILHLANKTPIDWYSKKQATVETATYGSEFVAARTCVEQIIDLRNTLRYLGVPIRDKSYMFGDNQSVVNSSMQVFAKLHKRHTMLSFHRVREAIAAGLIDFNFIPGSINPADLLSKHWSYTQIWTQLRSVLFWEGDTAEIE
jgi:Reverse transcriptase (RNA-dependent DNA polymerase)